MQFTSYNKRVTLNLAMHSECTRERPGLLEVLDRTSAQGFQLESLAQADVEAIYAEFDEELERQIISEWEVDPTYLEDHRGSFQVCPLCFHEGLRFLFRIRNRVSGHTVRCGSVCILQHGISVKGAETAEHAKKILDAAIRRQLRACEIEAWHESYQFKAEYLQEAEMALASIRSAEHGGQVYWTARAKLRELRSLKKAYQTSGWLGTAKRWEKWTKIAGFARKFDLSCRDTLPRPLPWGDKKSPAQVAIPDEPLPEQKAEMGLRKLRGAVQESERQEEAGRLLEEAKQDPLFQMTRDLIG